MYKLFHCQLSRGCPCCNHDSLENVDVFIIAKNLKEVNKILDENYDITDDFCSNTILINKLDQINQDFYKYEVLTPEKERNHFFVGKYCLESFVIIFRKKLKKYEKIECLKNQLYLFDTKFSNKFQNRIQKNKEIIKEELKKAEEVMAKRFRGRMEYVL